MKLELRDFNGADALLRGDLKREWRQIRRVLEELPLHLKASGQKGKEGTPIFDPVATNAAIKTSLASLGWATNIVIPKEVSFLYPFDEPRRPEFRLRRRA